MLRAGVAILSLAVASGPAAQQEQKPRSNPAWPCIPGRAIDPNYITVAEGSGGQVFLFDPSEIARSHVLMTGRMQHEETIFRSSGNLTSAARSFEFPVDSAVESLLISVSLQCRQSISVSNPAGQEVIGSGAATDDHEFKSGRILKFTPAAPGNWRVRIAGQGMYFVVAEAKSTLALDEVRFVEQRGRPGHEGWFPVNRPPRLNVEQMLELALSGPVRDANFFLVSSSAERIQDLDLPAASEDGNYLGPVTPRAKSFRIVVQGRDENDWPFQRMHPALFQTAP